MVGINGRLMTRCVVKTIKGYTEKEAVLRFSVRQTRANVPFSVKVWSDLTQTYISDRLAKNQTGLVVQCASFSPYQDC